MPDDWLPVPRYRPWALLACGHLSRSDFYRYRSIIMLIERGEVVRLHCAEHGAGERALAIFDWEKRGGQWT